MSPEDDAVQKTSGNAVCAEPLVLCTSGVEAAGVPATRRTGVELWCARTRAGPGQGEREWRVMRGSGASSKAGSQREGGGSLFELALRREWSKMGGHVQYVSDVDRSGGICRGWGDETSPEIEDKKREGEMRAHIC